MRSCLSLKPVALSKIPGVRILSHRSIQRQQRTQRREPKPKPKPKPNLKIVKVTAAKILKDYEANELASDAKYKGNLIQVRGVVRKIDKEIFGSDYVLEIGTVNEYEILTVDCNGMSKKVLSTLYNWQEGGSYREV